MSDEYPIIKQTRYHNTKTETLSKMRTPAGTDYDCVELPDLDNKSNVSCIPTGRYPVFWTWSPAFGRYMYQICNVKGRTGIRIHGGHDVDNTQGCQILGFGVGDADKDGKIGVLNSAKAVKQFEDEMQRKPFYLEISDE